MGKKKSSKKKKKAKKPSKEIEKIEQHSLADWEGDDFAKVITAPNLLINKLSKLIEKKGYTIAMQQINGETIAMVITPSFAELDERAILRAMRSVNA